MFFSSIIINFKFSVMKKFFLVVLAMVMLGSVQAQTAFKNKVEGVTGTEFFFGPKFGFNVASISDGLNKSKFSFHRELLPSLSLTIFSVYKRS